MSVVVIKIPQSIMTPALHSLAQSFQKFIAPQRISGAYVGMEKGYSRMMMIILPNVPIGEAGQAAVALQECLKAAHRMQLVTVTPDTVRLCDDLWAGLTQNSIAVLACKDTIICAESVENAGNLRLVLELDHVYGPLCALPGFDREENIDVALRAALRAAQGGRCLNPYQIRHDQQQRKVVRFHYTDVLLK